MLNPFALCLGLYNTYIIACWLLKTRMGRHWAFALENDIAFCADETTLDYWRLGKLQYSNSHTNKACFSVVRVRCRWSGSMCKVVAFRLPNVSEVHSAALIGDAIHLVSPHEASTRALAVIIIKLPSDTSAQLIDTIKDTFSTFNMWARYVPSHSTLFAVASITRSRWEGKTDTWCRKLVVFDGLTTLRLQFALDQR